jgi:hypothetical protein
MNHAMMLFDFPKGTRVSYYMLVLLFTFALFGASATYFSRFLYCYWFKREVRPIYIWRAGGCALLIIVLSFVGQVLV